MSKCPYGCEGSKSTSGVCSWNCPARRPQQFHDAVDHVIDEAQAAAPPLQSAERPQGEGLTEQREAEIRRILTWDGSPEYRGAIGELLSELTRLRRQLAEEQRDRRFTETDLLDTAESLRTRLKVVEDAYHLVGEECSHWASETAKCRDFLARYIEVATEREQELGARCASLESRLQAAQGLVEKWRAMKRDCPYCTDRSEDKSLCEIHNQADRCATELEAATTEGR